MNGVSNLATETISTGHLEDTDMTQSDGLEAIHSSAYTTSRATSTAAGSDQDERPAFLVGRGRSDAPLPQEGPRVGAGDSIARLLGRRIQDLCREYDLVFTEQAEECRFCEGRIWALKKRNVEWRSNPPLRHVDWIDGYYFHA